MLVDSQTTAQSQPTNTAWKSRLARWDLPGMDSTEQAKTILFVMPELLLHHFDKTLDTPVDGVKQLSGLITWVL